MAKKKAPHTAKKLNDHHQGGDNAASGKSHSNNNKRKAKTLPNGPAAMSSSSSSTSYLVLIGLSVTIATVAIVYNIDDLQHHLVKLTNIDSSASSTQSANIPDDTNANIPTDSTNGVDTGTDTNSDTDSNRDGQKHTAETAEKSATIKDDANTADLSNGASKDQVTNTDETVDETDSGKSDRDAKNDESEKSGIDGISAKTDENDETKSGKTGAMVSDVENTKTAESSVDEVSTANPSDKSDSGGGCPFKGGRKKKKSSESLEEGGDGEKIKTRRRDYEKYSITCREDYKIRKKLDAADQLLEQENFGDALKKYDDILTSLLYSPRALWGKAQVLDILAERQRSNARLEEAMLVMSRALRVPDTPPDLAVLIGSRLAQRQEFRGWDGKAAATWAFLAGRFPTRTEFKNKQGISFLRSGQNDKARDIFKQVLDQAPDDGEALVHLGFILKVIDLDYQQATSLLQRGIDSGQPGANLAKFYYHLGDAYVRLNQSEKAHAVYRRGAEQGQFISQYQRSLYNADTPLTGRPWWTAKQTTYTQDIELLEKNWKTIREEGLSQLDMKRGSFVPEEEHLRETGDWKQFTLYQRGMKNEENCKKVPKTCAILDRMPDAKGCKRGQVKYSVMHPGVHVWPHTGPTNCRLRAHLGLVVPQGPRIRVVNDTRTWTEGKVIIFDDSFEHEVWHDGTELRLILIVDFWHPDLTPQQKRMLSPI